MAIYRGDGAELIRQAIRTTDLRQKVELMEQGMLLHFAELGRVLENLGSENFNHLMFKELAQEVRACMESKK